eukprot:1625599-Pyramimonas_sp.AAC.1
MRTLVRHRPRAAGYGARQCLQRALPLLSRACPCIQGPRTSGLLRGRSGISNESRSPGAASCDLPGEALPCRPLARPGRA